MTWLNDICDVLEHPAFPQIHGELQIEHDGNITGKCALGELRCSKGVEEERSDDPDSIIMKAFGVPADLFDGLPELKSTWVGLSDKNGVGDNFEDPKFDELGGYDKIGNYIWKLNDCGFTYPEIVEFLKTTFEDAV